MSGGMRSLVFGGIAGGAAFLVSCSGIWAERARFLSAHPSLPPSVKNAIVNGDIVAGMSPSGVRVSWGEPENRLAELLPGGERVERWLYPRPFGGYVNIYEVKFVDGRVRAVTSRASRRPRRPLPSPAESLSLGVEIAHDVVNARRYLELRDTLRLAPAQVKALEGIRRAYRAGYERRRDFIGLYRAELYRLVRSDDPDIVLVQERLDDIERLQSDLRDFFVRSMQDAANVLTPPQRQLLSGAKTLFPAVREQR